MPRRQKYQIEAKLARKREIESEHQRLWNSQCKYYDQFTRSNQRYQTWTSPEMSTCSLNKYQELEEKRNKERQMEEERNRRDLELFEQRQREEIAAKEEMQRKRNRFNRNKDVSVDILRELNENLKSREEVERRLNAEKKLYEQWKVNHPTIRQAECNQRQSNLKIAWLDAQINKQMEKEKEELELKKMLEEREKKIKEDEELEKQYETQLKEKEAKINEIVAKQLDELKQKDLISSTLHEEELAQQQKKSKFEEVIKKKDEIQSRRNRLELDLYNLNQYRLKLRRRAKIIAEEVDAEKRLLEQVLEMQQSEKDEETAKKANLKQTLERAVQCLKEQQDLEAQRQEYLSFIFDSEARTVWHKQESLWQQEQKARDNLFEEVFNTIRQQIDEQLNKKIDEQRKLVEEKENMLRRIEEADEELRREREEIQRKKVERREELDAMIDNKLLLTKQASLLEELEREKQLSKLKEEEERLRKEIAAIQLETRPKPVFYPRRRIVW